MGRISSLFVHRVLACVDARVDTDALLREVGVDPDASADAAVMVRDVDYYEMLERLADEDPRAADLPLRVGARMRCADFGAVGLAMQSAPTLVAGWQRCARYGRFLTSVSTYGVEETPDAADLHLYRAGERRTGLCMSNEATLAGLYAISSEVAAQPFRPQAVFFRHAARTSPDVHEAHFGCPVHFDSDRDALRVAREVLEGPNRLGDESTMRFFDAHLEQELARRSASAPVDVRVRTCIARSLSEGVPTVSEIAAQLGTSGRTLQRQLADVDRTFQGLVDEARRHVAERLLAETDYPLADVAFLTGFSEQSALTRAFRRWTGTTPRAFRLKRRSA